MAPALDLKKLTIGFVPGTGRMGGLLAGHLSKAGLKVIIGSRDPEKAKLKASQLTGSATGASNQEAAAAADVIFYAPQGSLEEREQFIKSLAKGLENKIIVDVTNVLYLLDESAWGQVSAVTLNQKALGVPARWTTAFKSTFWKLLDDPPSADKPHETLVVGDDAEAVETTIALVETVPGFKAIRAGGLRNAKIVELVGPPWVVELDKLNAAGSFRSGWRFGL
eukprot:TRINITY_DN9226_c0_g1_i1.p1 TRINITY_DN9226_c0_g1~~TRINITY_DN9226_c0_g1_i1.p1  ORF type:complete len:231 (-),score=26.38 TRINITY_DN9226_c0_g1_i1:296-964(-)